jgi:sigma-B regulation protein RsbU (phosphoserine phosphatase)
VVLVEDDPVLRRVLELFLEQDYTVDACSTVAEAMSALESGDAEVVISDISMPEINGFELRRWLDANPPTGPATGRPRFIFVSSYDDSVTLRQAEDVGFDAFLVKPVSKAQLIEAIRGVLGRP